MGDSQMYSIKIYKMKFFIRFPKQSLTPNFSHSRIRHHHPLNYLSWETQRYPFFFTFSHMQHLIYQWLLLVLASKYLLESVHFPQFRRLPTQSRKLWPYLDPWNSPCMDYSLLHLILSRLLICTFLISHHTQASGPCPPRAYISLG